MDNLIAHSILWAYQMFIMSEMGAFQLFFHFFARAR